jgi:hypothetical protein
MPNGKPPRTTSKRKRAKAPAKAKTAARRKAPAARKAATAAKRKATTTAKPKARGGARSAGTKAKRRAGGARGRTTALPRDVLRSLEDGQRAALDAVRKFVDTVDSALPLRGESASRRQEVVDSALEMAERLVQTQYDFLRRVMHSAGKPFGDSDKRS